MRFTRPLLLLLLLLLPTFAWTGWPRGRYGRGRAWAGLAVRCLLVSLVVLSLAGLQSVHGSNTLAVVFAIDGSDSVNPGQRERAFAFVAEAIAQIEPGDQAAVVLFGANALVERPMSSHPALDTITSRPATQQTDLSKAVRLALALFPPGAARHLVILSDGHPTSGDAESAIRLARAQGVQVDVVPLGAPLRAEVWLGEIDIPTRLHQGEAFAASVAVESTVATTATLTLLSGDRVVTEQGMRLAPGRTQFALPLLAEEPGFATYRAVLAPAADTYPQNNELTAFTMIEGPPRVLIVAEEEQAAGPLKDALQSTGLEVREALPGALASDAAALAQYAAVIVVDIPARALSPRAMAALQTFVRDLGGGLVAVGGSNAYGVGGWYDTPLEEALPVDMTLHDPQRFPPMSIVVIIDKSGSMSVLEGGVEKIRLAGEAAARVAELIHEEDEITVIAFDDRPADVIGPLPGSRRDEVIDQVIRLQAGGGGIYVRESLQAALERLEESRHPVRHILLLADGSDSEHQQGVAELVREEITGQNISLSTVAIGAGQDLPFLEQIAALGGGRSYFTDRAVNLPVIFAQETQLAMRSYIVEEPFYPRQTATSPVLEAIDTVPQLAGYVATTPKAVAQVILTTHQGDPLLASWQYGLGRAVAWTSDASGRWAARWTEWDGFPRFWSQVVRWALSQQSDLPLELSVTMEEETARIRVDAVDSEGRFLNELELTASVVPPGREPVNVPLEQSAPGRYEGTFAPGAEGAYLLRISGAQDGESLGITGGWVLGYSPEYAALDADPDYLSYLAALGGGAVLEAPAEALAHTAHGRGTTRDLWPVLLGLATVLLPFDVAVRRLALTARDLAATWRRLTSRWSGRPPRQAGAELSPAGRLLAAKRRAEPPPGAPERIPRTPAPTSGPAGEAPEQPATPGAAEPEEEQETLARRLVRRRRQP